MLRWLQIKNKMHRIHTNAGPTEKVSVHVRCPVHVQSMFSPSIYMAFVQKCSHLSICTVFVQKCSDISICMDFVQKCWHLCISMGLSIYLNIHTIHYLLLFVCNNGSDFTIFIDFPKHGEKVYGNKGSQIRNRHLPPPPPSITLRKDPAKNGKDRNRIIYKRHYWVA